MLELNATVRYTGAGLQFTAVANSGHGVLMDGPKEHGGTDSGPRPTELILMGLGGCTGMDVISILKKKKQDVSSLTMNIRGMKTEDHPARIAEVHIEYVVRGRGVEEAAVERAVDLSVEKYCSVKATLEGNTKVTFGYRIESEESVEAAK